MKIDELPTSPNDNAPDAESVPEEEKEEEAELDRNRRPHVWRRMINGRNKTIQSLKDLLAKKEAQIVDWEKE